MQTPLANGKLADWLLDDRIVLSLVHDMASPVTVILGCTDLLREQWDDATDAEKLRLLERVRTSAGQLADLTNDVLESSQNGTDPMDHLDRRHLDLRRLIVDTVDEMRAVSSGRLIEVGIEGDRPLSAFADERAQRRVLENLISNAIKYSPAGTTVLVTAIPSADGFVVGVRNRGHEISRMDQARLFRPFSRLGSADGIKGTGLGLSICKELVEKQGGHLNVESSKTRGTVFSYTVPAA